MEDPAGLRYARPSDQPPAHTRQLPGRHTSHSPHHDLLDDGNVVKKIRLQSADSFKYLKEHYDKRVLKPEEVPAVLGHGRPGSAKLRKALGRHLPRLALTRLELERRFLALCERAPLPLPEVNARVGRMSVDALWCRERIAVELDGYEGHRTRAQTERDRHRDLHARMAGFTAIRYTWRQINDEPELVAADLQRQLSSSAPSA